MRGGRDVAGPLRILHVVPYFPPDRVGGVGEVVAHLHAALLRRGHDSRVVTSGASRDDPRILRTGRSPDGFVASSAFKVGLTRGVDVVHVHHGEALGLLAAMKALRVATPILLTLHASPRHIGRALRPYGLDGRPIAGEPGLIRRSAGTRVRQAMDRAAMALASRTNFIAMSTAQDYLGEHAADRATVIYNGLPEIGEQSSDGVGGPEPAELLYVGSYSVRKRVQVLPTVLARVRSHEPAARLRVVGFDPVRRQEFSELARREGVDDAVVSSGVLSSADIARHYRTARVLLVPSAYEGLPMVIMEAMQNGLPCVATRVSGHPEIIEDGVNGFLVPVDDPEAMAEAALRILRDRDLARRMGEAGRTTVSQRFGLQRQVDEYLGLYRTVVQEARR